MKTTLIVLCILIQALGVMRGTADSGAPVADEIDALRNQITLKIDEDLERTAIAFADARELNRALFWSDLFSAPLEIFTNAISGLIAYREVTGLFKPSKVRNWASDGFTAANSAQEAHAILFSFERLQQDGQNLALAIDGPSFGARTEAIIARAEETVTFLHFDKHLYQESIRNDLYGIGGVASPLSVLRRSGLVDRRGGSVLPSIFEARRTIRNDLQTLSSQIRSTEIAATRSQELIAYVRTLKQAVQQSRAGTHRFIYQAVLTDDLGVKNLNVDLSIGYPRSLENWRSAMINQFASNTAVEIRLRMIELISDSVGIVSGDAVDAVNLRLDVEAVVAGQTGANKLAEGVGVLTMGVLADQFTGSLDDVRSFASNAREQVTYIPQQMMEALPGEVSNLILVADDVSRKVKTGTATGPRPSISSVSPLQLLGKPLPQTTTFTITGTNFSSASRLEFKDGVNPSYTNRVPTFTPPNQLTYAIAVGMETATWTVKVVNPGAEPSLPAKFNVIGGTSSGATLTSFAVEGSAYVNENSSKQFIAKAYFSDGSSQEVQANATCIWSENSSKTSINATGLLTAGSVSLGELVTVSATYTHGGTSLTADTTIYLNNSSIGGGPNEVELIQNGGFEDEEADWTATGSFHASTNFTTSRRGSGYAYLSLTDGTAANNLDGTIWQEIQIPANSELVTLTYWINATTAETLYSARDTLDIEVRNTSNQVIATLGTYDNGHALSDGNTKGVYHQGLQFLTNYAGQTIRVAFRGKNKRFSPHDLSH